PLYLTRTLLGSTDRTTTRSAKTGESVPLGVNIVAPLWYSTPTLTSATVISATSDRGPKTVTLTNLGNARARGGPPNTSTGTLSMTRSFRTSAILTTSITLRGLSSL